MPDSLLLGRFRTRHVRAGFFEEDGELWAPGGTLVAQSRQLGLLMGAERQWDDLRVPGRGASPACRRCVASGLKAGRERTDLAYVSSLHLLSESFRNSTTLQLHRAGHREALLIQALSVVVCSACAVAALMYRGGGAAEVAVQLSSLLWLLGAVVSVRAMRRILGPAEIQMAPDALKIAHGEFLKEPTEIPHEMIEAVIVDITPDARRRLPIDPVAADPRFCWRDRQPAYPELDGAEPPNVAVIFREAMTFQHARRRHRDSPLPLKPGRPVRGLLLTVADPRAARGALSEYPGVRSGMVIESVPDGVSRPPWFWPSVVAVTCVFGLAIKLGMPVGGAFLLFVGACAVLGNLAARAAHRASRAADGADA